MSSITFDILGYVRRLKEVGVPEPQAEVHVQVLVDALSKSMDSLVTKEYLGQCLDARFAEQDLRIEKRFNEFESRSEKRFSAFEAELKLQRWILAAIAASTVAPALVRLFST